jgi:hypothetical protein
MAKENHHATVQDLLNAHANLQGQINSFLMQFPESLQPATAAPQPPAPAPQTVVTASSKSSVAKPEPFTGKSTEVRSFLANFKDWAVEQKDLGSDKRYIGSVLSYLQGEAATWAAPYTEKAIWADSVEGQEAQAPYPFNGNYGEFEKQFKARFGSFNGRLKLLHRGSRQ